MSISKDTFALNAGKGYDKVIWQQQGVILDCDFNEAQDMMRDARDRLVTALAGTANLLGSAGVLTASATARSVDVASGVAVHNGVFIRLPAATALQAFATGTTTGIQNSVIYCEWWDDEVTAGDDAAWTDATYGAGSTRYRRNVRVLAAQNTSVLPGPSQVGRNVFKIADVSHDFTTNGVFLTSATFTLAGVAPSLGELAGRGPARTLSLKSAAPAAQVAYSFDTLNTQTGNLLVLKNAGTAKVYIDAAGSIGIGVQPTQALDVNGAVKLRANVDITGNVTLGANATVDGVDLDVHAHDGTAKGGPKVSHATLTGLTTSDDHPQYVHTNRAAATNINGPITFAPTVGNVPFSVAGGANGVVTNLNADMVDGVHASALLTTVAAAAAYLALAGGTVTGALTVNGRAKLTGNAYGPAANGPTAVTASQQFQFANVGARALVCALSVDPGAYTGAYDIVVYDNAGSGNIVAQWSNQSGAVTDKVPWYFVNARSDEALFVVITKQTQTGTPHNFTVTLTAERFA